MYSVIVSIVINFVVGIVLLFEVILVALLVWTKQESFIITVIKYSIFCVLLSVLCAWYNCRRYKRVVEKKSSKLMFHLTLWIPLLAYTTYWFLSAYINIG